MTYSDRDNNGVVGVSDIEQVNSYYPFGLNMDGPWNGANGAFKYGYNGKEWNDDFGLGWNDYGARFYDAAIGIWRATDPLAESFSNVSSYNYALNNPILLIDKNGMASSYNWDTQRYEDENGKEVSWDDVQKEHEIGNSSCSFTAYVTDKNMVPSDSRDADPLAMTLFSATRDTEKECFRIFQVSNAEELSEQLGKSFAEGTLDNLIFDGHGSANSAYFKVGSARYDLQDEEKYKLISENKDFEKIAKILSHDGQVVVLSCYAGCSSNGGVDLMRVLAKKLNNTVFASVGYCAGTPSIFTGKRYLAMEGGAGQCQGDFIKVSPTGSVTSVQNVRFNNKGSVTYEEN